MMTKLHTLQDYTRVREIKFILAIPANDHLIQIFEVFIDSENYQLHIVMECMEQNLYQMMKHRRRRVFSIPSLKSILSQILAGLKHIHEHNFFHQNNLTSHILLPKLSHEVFVYRCFSRTYRVLCFMSFIYNFFLSFLNIELPI